MSPVRRIPRILGPILGVALLLAVLVLGVFPTRTYMDQRRAMATADEQLRVLRTENGALEDRVARLHEDAEIERLARAQYNLVFPGEEAYALLPAPEDGPVEVEPTGSAGGTVAPPEPESQVAAEGDDSPNLLERALDTLASIF